VYDRAKTINKQQLNCNSQHHLNDQINPISSRFTTKCKKEPIDEALISSFIDDWHKMMQH